MTLFQTLNSIGNRLQAKSIRTLLYLGLCSAYLQGGLNKLLDYPGAVAEMAHFSLTPPDFFAVAVILLELICPLMILLGVFRWLGALILAGFTLGATLMALRFWEMSVGEARTITANTFFEHLGLCSAFLLIVWQEFNTSARLHVKQS